MQRSGSQKVLLVVSILEIISAAIILIMGILALFGAGAAATISTGDAEVDQIAQLGTATGLSVASILALVVGGWSLFCGILGVRAANDNQKIMIVWVFSLIGLILAVIGVVLAIFGGSFADNWWSYVSSLIWPGLMFWVANNIKQEAGK